MNDGRISMKEAMENIASATKALPTAEECLRNLSAQFNIPEHMLVGGECNFSGAVETERQFRRQSGTPPE